MEKLSRGGIYKPSAQAEVLKFFSRGGIYKPSLQAEIFQNPQEVEFINQDYRMK